MTLLNVTLFPGHLRNVGLMLLVVVFGSACASTTPGDPFESYNRSMYSFNQSVDNAILKPTATAYKNYVPEPIQLFTRNFFSNLDDVFVGINNFLQGKPVAALNDWTRVLLNTTFGFFGIADPATEMGWRKQREDFGQTLGVWGVPAGPFVVLPLLGPSSVRDTAGTVVDYAVDPTGYAIAGNMRLEGRTAQRIGAAGLRLIDTRSRLLGVTDLLQAAALDEYSFVRDGYRQRRRSAVYDGDPPPLDPLDPPDPADAPKN